MVQGATVRIWSPVCVWRRLSFSLRTMATDSNAVAHRRLLKLALLFKYSTRGNSLLELFACSTSGCVNQSGGGGSSSCNVALLARRSPKLARKTSPTSLRHHCYRSDAEIPGRTDPCSPKTPTLQSPLKWDSSDQICTPRCTLWVSFNCGFTDDILHFLFFLLTCKTSLVHFRWLQNINIAFDSTVFFDSSL